MLKFNYKFFDSTTYTYEKSSRSPQKFKDTEMFTCSGPKGVLALFSRDWSSHIGQYDMHLSKSGFCNVTDHSTAIDFKDLIDDSKLIVSQKDGEPIDKNPFFEVLEEFYKDFVMTGKVKYISEVE